MRRHCQEESSAAMQLLNVLPYNWMCEDWTDSQVDSLVGSVISVVPAATNPDHSYGR